jgi:hypothetical protein
MIGNVLKIIAGLAVVGLLVLLIVSPKDFLQVIGGIAILGALVLLMVAPGVFWQLFKVAFIIGFFILFILCPELATFFAIFLFVGFVKYGRPF